MSSSQHPRRLTFQESMELAPLTPHHGQRRYMGRRGGWLPGLDLAQMDEASMNPGKAVLEVRTATFGGHVYAQSIVAVCQALQDKAREAPPREGSQTTDLRLFEVHTIHGYFTLPGRPDRPFLYNVSLISRGKTFLTARVDARQPLQASASGINYHAGECPVFPSSDGEQLHLRPQDLGAVCFTAVVSFVLPQPHSMGLDRQEESAQHRFAAILQSRKPAEWDPSPPVDMDLLVEGLGIRDVVGTFPMVDMKKVDMADYNAGRPLHERRDVILYRLLAPLPRDRANWHILTHAYAADRNGLLMAANHMGFVLHKKTASLSNSFVVHTNAEAAVMDFDAADPDREDQWWVQEVCFPRTGAGRAIVHLKIWSPQGVHVATEYQDGLCVADENVPLEPKL